MVASELATALAFAAVLSLWAALALVLVGAIGAAERLRRRALAASGSAYSAW